MNKERETALTVVRAALRIVVEDRDERRALAERIVDGLDARGVGPRNVRTSRAQVLDGAEWDAALDRMTRRVADARDDREQATRHEEGEQ